MVRRGSTGDSGTDTTYSGGGSSTDSGSGVTGDDDDDTSYSGGGDTSTDAPTGSTGADDSSGGSDDFGGGGDDDDDSSGVVGGGGSRRGSDSDTTYSGGGSSTDTGSGVTGDDGSDTTFSGGGTSTDAPTGSTGADDPTQPDEPSARERVADRLDGSADRGVSVTTYPKPGSGGQLERSERVRQESREEQRQLVAEDVAEGREGVTAEDVTVTSTASGFQATIFGDSGGRRTVITGAPARSRTETEVRTGETAERGVGITRGPAGGEIVLPERERRSQSGEPADARDFTYLSQAQRSGAGGESTRAAINRATRRGNEDNEQFGDIDWSFGFGGPDDEVETAVDSLPRTVRRGAAGLPGTNDARQVVAGVEETFPESDAPRTGSVTGDPAGNLAFAREGADQARNLLGVAEGVAAAPGTALEAVEAGAYATGDSPRLVNAERASELTQATAATGEAAAESAAANPRRTAGAVLTEAALSVGVGAASKGGLVRARGRLATRGMDFQGDVDFEDIERPDVRSGENRLTTFSEEAVPGGKRSTDPGTFPVETEAGDPAGELRNLADEYDDPQIRAALDADPGERTLFSARSGVKSSRFEPRSGRPYDPDAAFFAGSVSRNFLDVDGTPETARGLRRPRPVEAAKSLASAARREDTPTIVATAGEVRELPDDVRDRGEITDYLQERRNMGEFYVRQSDNQSGEAEAVVSASGETKVDPDPGAGRVAEGEATEFVEVGDPLQTEVRGERVPIQAFRQNTDDVTPLSQQRSRLGSFIADERGMVGGSGRGGFSAGRGRTLSDDLGGEPSYRPGGRRGTPFTPAPIGGGSMSEARSERGEQQPSAGRLAFGAGVSFGFGSDIGGVRGSTATVGSSGFGSSGATFASDLGMSFSETGTADSGTASSDSPNGFGSPTSPTSTSPTVSDAFGISSQPSTPSRPGDTPSEGGRPRPDLGSKNERGVGEVRTSRGGDQGRYRYESYSLLGGEDGVRDGLDRATNGFDPGRDLAPDTGAGDRDRSGVGVDLGVGVGEDGVGVKTGFDVGSSNGRGGAGGGSIDPFLGGSSGGEGGGGRNNGRRFDYDAPSMI